MRRWCAIGTAAMIGLVLTSPAGAQDRPTVFVHGLGGSPGSWQAAADRLRAELEISAYVPAVPWTEHFETQAGTLQGQLSVLPSNAIAIGHSNGGIVSRQWSTNRPLSGVVTVGSPQQGAPIVNNALSILGFHESMYYSAGAVFAALGAQPNQWWDVYVYVELALALTQNLGFDAFYKVAGLGLLANYPVLPQMASGSAFLTQLNSTGNLAREASAIPARVGLVYELDRYWQAGVIRLFDPRAADVWYHRIWSMVATFEFAGSYLMINYPTNPGALTIANGLFAASSYLRSFDPAWCWAVTRDWSCGTPHDGIVPLWSQVYPGASNIYVHGPSHLQETQVSDSALSYALATYMQVSHRGGEGGGGGGEGGGGKSASDELRPGESLQPGDSRTSSNGEYSLHYQGDGNLVLYRNSDGRPLWSTSTFGSPGEAAMQGDGNFVVYNSTGQPQWWSGTAGYSGAWLAVQSDGNLVVYDAYGYPLWWRQ